LIVVADSSPLNYLILIGEANILHRLYGRVLIPHAVAQELQHVRTPPVVRDWLVNKPIWLEIQDVKVSKKEGLLELDLGEREAIVLAQKHLPDVLLLMDEENGRHEADQRHIRTTGTLGVLEDAASRGFLDLSVSLARLRTTNFRVSESLLQWFLDRDAHRRKRKT